MKQKRYGDCEVQHAESTIKSGIRDWVKSTESDYSKNSGKTFSKQEIEELVTDQFKSIVLNDYGDRACGFVNCDME